MIQLEDLLDSRQAARRLGKSVAAIRRYTNPRDPYYSIEPVRIGKWQNPKGGRGARSIVFTRRMIDAARAGAAFVQATAAEAGQVFDTRGAAEYLTGLTGADWTPQDVKYYYHRAGRLPGKLIGQSVVFVKQDLDRFAQDVQKRA